MATAQQVENLARMIYEKGQEFGPAHGFRTTETAFDDAPAEVWGVSMQVSSYVLDHIGDVLFGSGQ